MAAGTGHPAPPGENRSGAPTDPVPVHVATERRAFFTPKTLAAYLAISERTVRTMLSEGTIPSYRVEGARRIDAADVDHYLAKRREERAA